MVYKKKKTTPKWMAFKNVQEKSGICVPVSTQTPSEQCPRLCEVLWSVYVLPGLINRDFGWNSKQKTWEMRSKDTALLLTATPSATPSFALTFPVMDEKLCNGHYLKHWGFFKYLWAKSSLPGAFKWIWRTKPSNQLSYFQKGQEEMLAQHPHIFQ